MGTISIEAVRFRLAMVWLAGFFLEAGVLFFRDLEGYDSVVWGGWFLPLIVPALTLMLGALGAGALGPPDPRTVRRAFYLVSFWLSLGYLLLVLAVILRMPYRREDETLVDVLHAGDTLLLAVQGIVMGAIGCLFGRTSEPPPAATGA